jgi:tetratricopeptide (TPR) repeat protein
MNRNEEAVNCWGKVLKINSKDITALHMRSKYLNKLSRYPEALELSEEALK